MRSLNRGKARSSVHSTKLFVAGLPSAISPLEILAYFRTISPAFSLTIPGDIDLCERQQKKGFCYLVCFDSEIAQYVIKKKFFSFLNRTLTVMKQLEGVDLIIQNKKVKKCRVILKQVPSTITEAQLKHFIEERYGDLETIFRLRSKDPYSDINKKKANLMKFHSFSGYFKEKAHATALINLGVVTYIDGSTIHVHKHEYQNEILPFKASDKSTKPSSGFVSEARHRKCSFTREVRQMNDRSRRYCGDRSRQAQAALDHAIRSCMSTYFKLNMMTSRSFGVDQQGSANYRFNTATLNNAQYMRRQR